MGTDADESAELARAVRGGGGPLQIVGGGTKRFYGRATEGHRLSVCGHRGIVAYEPTELVITARAGTPLSDIEATLASRRQILGFEPPHFGEAATLGGALACGLSGPRRPYSGSARDFVLGVKILNGKGEILTFGGQVMKNVAGYDISRLMVGALGTLGILLEASLKVLPQPEHEITLGFSYPPERALAEMNRWAGRPLPVSGACHINGVLRVRLSGSESGVNAARAELGGDALPDAPSFWRDLREQRLPFFAGDAPLWRISLPPATPPLDIAGPVLLDWGGAQRWVRSEAPATDLWRMAEHAGGHATLFRDGDRAGEVFQPLSAPLARLHKNLKHAFDPEGRLNPGRLTVAW